jgi:hypothetical protein
MRKKMAMAVVLLASLPILWMLKLSVEYSRVSKQIEKTDKVRDALLGSADDQEMKFLAEQIKKMIEDGQKMVKKLADENPDDDYQYVGDDGQPMHDVHGNITYMRSRAGRYVAGKDGESWRWKFDYPKAPRKPPFKVSLVSYPEGSAKFEPMKVEEKKKWEVGFDCEDGEKAMVNSTDRLFEVACQDGAFVETNNTSK